MKRSPRQIVSGTKMRSPRQIVSDTKRSKAPPVKKNYTFRLNIDLMEKFVSSCEQNAVKPTDILTELMKDFCQEK